MEKFLHTLNHGVPHILNSFHMAQRISDSQLISTLMKYVALQAMSAFCQYVNTVLLSWYVLYDIDTLFDKIKH